MKMSKSVREFFDHAIDYGAWRMGETGAVPNAFFYLSANGKMSKLDCPLYSEPDQADAIKRAGANVARIAGVAFNAVAICQVAEVTPHDDESLELICVTLTFRKSERLYAAIHFRQIVRDEAGEFSDLIDYMPDTRDPHNSRNSDGLFNNLIPAKPPTPKEIKKALHYLLSQPGIIDQKDIPAGASYRDIAEMADARHALQNCDTTVVH